MTRIKIETDDIGLTSAIGHQMDRAKEKNEGTWKLEVTVSKGDRVEPVLMNKQSLQAILDKEDAEQSYSAKDLQEMWHISPATFWKWFNDPALEFPKPFLVGHPKCPQCERTLRWDWMSIVEWEQGGKGEEVAANARWGEGWQEAMEQEERLTKEIEAKEAALLAA
jgi:hypothetical protein